MNYGKCFVRVFKFYATTDPCYHVYHSELTLELGTGRPSTAIQGITCSEKSMYKLNLLSIQAAVLFTERLCCVY